MNDIALNRFLSPLSQLEAILQKGRYQKDKGIGFYQNKARDILFRLEALCRLYRNMHNKKVFDLWYKEFKSLEDLLGQLDHYETLHTTYSGYRNLKKSSRILFGDKFTEQSQVLSQALSNNGWLSGEKTNQFKSDLNEIDWPESVDDRKNFGNGMVDEIKKLLNKYDSGELDPNKVEEGIHEFRRRIRWVSIYAQAAGGTVQLRKQPLIPDELKKYCTEKVVSSPFNKLPGAKKNELTISIDASAFYALSWVIGYLSDLKDTGLSHHAFQSLTKHSGVKSTDLMKKIFSAGGISPENVSPLAEQAIDTFIYKDMIPQKISRDILRSIQ